MVVLPEEKKSHLQKEDFNDPTDALTQFYTNRDPREFATDERSGAEVLAEIFRGRWGVETSYRVIKNRFLPQSASQQIEHRMFLFGDAVLLYNLYTVANAIGADRDDDHDLGEHGKYWKEIIFLSDTIDDPASLEIGEVPERVIRIHRYNSEGCYLKFSLWKRSFRRHPRTE